MECETAPQISQIGEADNEVCGSAQRSPGARNTFWSRSRTREA